MGADRFRRLVLETSLKPFKSIEAGAIRATCRHLFKTWEKLIDRSEDVGILLWVGDGTEILEWSGDPDQSLTCAQYVGYCNLDARPDLYYPNWYINRPVPYIPDPPALKYCDLRFIIRELRAQAELLFGSGITVGAIFDPGPEFAFSSFKYKDHPEILFPQEPGKMRASMHFVTCQCVLRGDSRRYAAFPDGIPDGTSLGTFLGRQFASFARELGYDYIWLSNGFGYSHFAWAVTGELFEAGSFRPEKAAGEREKTNGFWRDFRAACPDSPIEVRGTNYSVGMDISVGGVSHADVTRIGGLEMMPPNIPGYPVELAKDVTTFLSRMAKTPSRRIVYRTYLNDPWFETNPWMDLYNREPYEIHASMSASRLNACGGAEGPTDLHILTVDTERGDLPPDEANEVIPHYLRALGERADAAGPLTWIYPFDEYDALLKEHPDRLSRVFFHDYFVEYAVDGGLPLLTVCSSDRFPALEREGMLPPTIFLAPAPAGDWAYAPALLRHVRQGGQAILYGPLDLAPPEMLEALGLRLAPEPLEGDFRTDVRLRLDEFERDAEPPVRKGEPPAKAVPASERPLKHRAVVSGGGLREVCGWDDPDLRIAASQGNAKRAYCVVRGHPEWKGGRLAWIRGTVPFDPLRPGATPFLRPHPRDAAWEAQRPQDWPRRLLSELGIDMLQHRGHPGTDPIRLFIKRHKGAWVFVGCKPDTTAYARIRTSDGAPIFMEYDTPIAGGYAEERFGKTIYNEVRFFVKADGGTCKAKLLSVPVGREYCALLTGCADAAVTIYPDPKALREGRVLVLPSPLADVIPGPGGVERVPCRLDEKRGCLVVENRTGPICIKW